MKSKIFLFSFILASIMIAGCSLNNSSITSNSQPEVIDVQAHNSKISIQKEGGNYGRSRSYDLIAKKLADKNQITVNDFTLGIKSLTLNHFRGSVSGKEGLILANKSDNDWVIVFDSVYDNEKTYSCNDVKKYDFPDNMISDCIK